MRNHPCCRQWRCASEGWYADTGAALPVRRRRLDMIISARLQSYIVIWLHICAPRMPAKYLLGSGFPESSVARAPQLSARCSVQNQRGKHQLTAYPSVPIWSCVKKPVKPGCCHITTTWGGNRQVAVSADLSPWNTRDVLAVIHTLIGLTRQD